MPLSDLTRPITSAEASAEKAEIIVKLPSIGFLEAVELISADKWLLHAAWIQLGSKIGVTGCVLIGKNVVVDHSNWSGHISLESNLYLVASFKGSYLTATNQIRLNWKVS